MGTSTATYAPVLAAVSAPQTDGRTEHYLELQGSRYVDELDTWRTADKFELRRTGTYDRYSVLYIGPAGTVRNMDAATGEHTPGRDSAGPYAALIEQATVISAYRDPIETVLLDIEPGDTLVIRGQRFRVVPEPRVRGRVDVEYVGPQFPSRVA